MLIFEIAGLVEITLVVLEGVGILKDGLLPLGGGHLQQIGAVFAMAFVIERIVELAGH